MRARQADASIRPSLYGIVAAAVLLSRLSGWRFISTYASKRRSGVPRRGSVSPEDVTSVYLSRPGSSNSTRTPMSEYSFAASQESDAPLLQNPHDPLSPGSSKGYASPTRFPRDAAVVVSPAFSSPGTSSSARHARSASDGNYSPPFSIESSPVASGTAFRVVMAPVRGESSGNGRLLARHPTACQVLSLQSCDWPEQQSRGDNRQSSSMKMPEDLLDVPPVYRDRIGV